MPTLPNHTAMLRELLALDNERRSLKPKSNTLAEATVKIDALRARLPTALLIHYDNRRSRSKLPIAPVANGVCRACHLTLPSGRISELRRNPGVVQLCENCGAFIYLPEEEIAAPEPVSESAPTNRSKARTKARA